MTVPARMSMSQPPRLDLEISPARLGQGAAGAFGVRFRLDHLTVGEGEVLLTMPSRITSVETMEAQDLVVTDAGGSFSPEKREVLGDATADHRQWIAPRSVDGPVEVSYTLPARPVDEHTISAPLYDLRAEGGGLNGIGLTILALPEVVGPVELTLGWDLGGCPDGTRAVTSWGEGEVHLQATLDELRYAHLSVGPVRSFPPVGDPGLEDFGLFWTSEPNFDPVDVATYVRDLYAEMARFFREPEPGFRVFARKHPYKGTGGCGLTRSFIFGFCDQLVPSDEDLKALLAHETVHSWVTLSGEKAEQSWYSEGLADYYSILLPYRAGLVDEAAYLDLVSSHTDLYYANPLQSLRFDEAMELFWSDSRAQRVPYGRGFLYFVELAGRLREHGVDLDDLVLEVLDRQRAGEQVGTVAWVEIVARTLGAHAQEMLDAMLAGVPLVPGHDALGERFVGEPAEVRVLELGFATASLSGDRVVRDLVPGSAAERAGVRDGDRIVSGTSFAELESDTQRRVRLEVLRDGRGTGEDAGDEGTGPVQIEYRADGPAVTGLRWRLRD